MAKVQKGDKVKVHYKGTLSNGQQFDSSEGREPLEFQLGSGMVIPGFDDGVTGMEVGEKKTIVINSEDAYGPVNEDLIIQFDRNNIPDNIPLEVGITLFMHPSNGSEQEIPVIVREVTETHVTLDANHELAGQDLTFELELVEIV